MINVIMCNYYKRYSNFIIIHNRIILFGMINKRKQSYINKKNPNIGQSVCYTYLSISVILRK